MSAIETKDHLLGLIVYDDLAQLIVNCHVIITVLTHTEGLWKEASYCYKASEICEQAIKALDSGANESLHYRRRISINETRMRLFKLSERYHQLQQEYMESQRLVLN